MRLHKGLIKGSFILGIVFGIYGFLNFIFQSSMARLLTVTEYGVLAALFYLVYILSIFSESIQTVFSKQASLEKDNGKLKNIIKRANKKILFAAFAFAILYLILAVPFSIYKEIPYSLLAINGLFIFSSLLLPITRGVMQGRKKFGSLGVSLMIEAFVKLILSISLVYIGWKTYGAIFGAVAGTFAALLFSFFSINEIYKEKEKIAATAETKDDSKSIFMLTFSLIAFYITDIFIAQLVFNKELAGYYSIASILAKAIFWGTQPIGRAMLPLSVEESLDKNKEQNHDTFFNSLAILSICVCAALLLFFFFSSFIIRIFAGRYIPESAQILFYLGIATSLLSFANLNVLYKISKKKPRIRDAAYFFALFVIGTILLIIFNDSLTQFSIAFITTSAIFLFFSIFLMND